MKKLDWLKDREQFLKAWLRTISIMDPAYMPLVLELYDIQADIKLDRLASRLLLSPEFEAQCREASASTEMEGVSSKPDTFHVLATGMMQRKLADDLTDGSKP